MLINDTTPIKMYFDADDGGAGDSGEAGKGGQGTEVVEISAKELTELKNSIARKDELITQAMDESKSWKGKYKSSRTELESLSNQGADKDKNLEDQLSALQEQIQLRDQEIQSVKSSMKEQGLKVLIAKYASDKALNLTQVERLLTPELSYQEINGQEQLVALDSNGRVIYDGANPRSIEKHIDLFFEENKNLAKNQYPGGTGTTSNKGSSQSSDPQTFAELTAMEDGPQTEWINANPLKASELRRKG